MSTFETITENLAGQETLKKEFRVISPSVFLQVRRVSEYVVDVNIF